MSLEKEFYEFIEERLDIYVRKNRGDSFPWTQDRTLQKHKFCNAQRHLDEGSQVLIREVIYNDSLNDIEKIKNIIFYRMFNTRNHFDIFGIVSNWTYEKQGMINHAEDALKRGLKIFNNAYAIRAPKPKYKNIIETLSNVNYIKIRHALKYFDPDSCIKVIKEEVKHCGDFIAGQIYLDCTYDKNLTTWTGEDFLIVGPGALEGLKLMYGEYFGGRDPESIIRHLWEYQPFIHNLQPYPERSKYDSKRLSLMDIQHCLCEFRKYLKWQKGEGMCRLYRRD